METQSGKSPCTLFWIAGRNTVEGMGKDISRGGEATQDAAKDVKKAM